MHLEAWEVFALVVLEIDDAWTRIDDWRLFYMMTWRLDILLGDVLSWMSRS